MIKILLVDGLDVKIIDILNEIPEVEITCTSSDQVEEFKSKLAVSDAVILAKDTPLSSDLFDVAINLKLIVRQGNISGLTDIDSVCLKNIEIRSTPSATAVSVAEYGLAVLLGICRYIGPVYHRFRNKEIGQGDFGEGVQLSGGTAGIIGYGRIGREVGTRLQALGMNVSCCDSRNVDTTTGVRQVDFKDILMNSEIIMIHLPKNKSSINMISEKELSLMKNSAIIVDLSGGGVIDKAALLKAMNTGKIHSVAMDLTDCDDTLSRILAEHSKFYPAPQIGEYTKEARQLSGLDVVTHVRDFFNV